MAKLNSSMNYPHPSNVSSAPDFFINYLDKGTGGTWTVVLLGLSFGIPFMALQAFDTYKAFGAASLNLLVTVVLMSVFNVITGFMYTIAVLAVAVALVINHGNGGVAR